MEINQVDPLDQPVCQTAGGPSYLILLVLVDSRTPPTHCKQCIAAYNELLNKNINREQMRETLQLFDTLLNKT